MGSRTLYGCPTVGQRRFFIKNGAALLICLLFPATCSGGTVPQDSMGNAAPVKALACSIENVLEETRAAAVGIALVNKDGPVWIAALGRANVSKNIPATDSTMFRLASVSKMFVALAILKLQEKGKLRLEDKIRDIIPEVEFENRWEKTHPVRIVHLLEHTTGWDEIHLPEMAHNDSVPIALKDALNFHPHTRTSRWPPGTRNAYSNTGAAVAAYIVEKVSGVPYETYVGQHFLVPLHMRNTTFLNDVPYQKLGAITYDDNHYPLPYRHLLYRAAGAMNSSPQEMANFVTMLLNEGRFDSLEILTRGSIRRMEQSKSTPGAQAGLEVGYGLGNFTSVHNGFIYHGHNGSLDGALVELAYLREHGIGHVILLSETNGEAHQRISRLIRDFETSSLDKSPLPAAPSIDDVAFNGGYYVSINPRNQGGLFMDYLIGAEKFEVGIDAVYRSWIFSNRSEKYVPVSKTSFIKDGMNNVSMVIARDPLAGEVLYVDMLVMKRIPSFIVYGQLILVIAWLLLMASLGLIWTVSSVQRILKGKSKVFLLCLLPTLTTLMFITLTALVLTGHADTDTFLARPGPLSIAILLFSLLIPLNSLYSFIVLYRARKQSINKTIFGLSTALSVLHLAVTIYLIWCDVLPLTTWS